MSAPPPDQKEKPPCPLCQMAEGKMTGHIVYEDEKVMAVLLEEGCALGHIRVFPKHHHQFLENMPDNEVDHLFLVASTASGVIFEALGLGGTNLLVDNVEKKGREHIAIEVIPRKQDDGINLQWERKQFSEPDMNSVQASIKDAAFMIGYKPPKKIVINLDEKKTPELKDEKGNYLFKQLHRIP